MFGSAVLDTAIALIFVFLLVSLLVTTINEMIAAVLGSRAKWLRVGLGRLVGELYAGRVLAHPLVAGTAAAPGRGPSYIPSRTFAAVLLDVLDRDGASVAAGAALLQGSVRSLSPLASPAQIVATVEAAAGEVAAMHPAAASLATSVVALARRLASPVGGDGTAAPAVSATALVAVLDAAVQAQLATRVRAALAALPNAPVMDALRVLLEDAGGDMAKFRENVEVWFNSAMDRVSGWYKRRSQFVIAVVALTTSVVLNIDAALLLRHLTSNTALREAVVQQAKAYAERPPLVIATGREAGASSASGETSAVDASPSETSAGRSASAADLAPRFGEIRRELAGMSLPVGWAGSDDDTTDPQREQRLIVPWRSDQRVLDIALYHLVGWLLTAIAATLGAPFWFDMLNKVISVRSAGKAPEERPKPPKQVPTPLEPGESPQRADAMAAIRGNGG